LLRDSNVACWHLCRILLGVSRIVCHFQMGCRNCNGNGGVTVYRLGASS
jgi:hypothetical protein